MRITKKARPSHQILFLVIVSGGYFIKISLKNLKDLKESNQKNINILSDKIEGLEKELKIPEYHLKQKKRYDADN